MPSLKERMALLNKRGGPGIMLGGLKPGGRLPPSLRKKQEQRSKTNTLAPVNHPELDKPVINVRRKSRSFNVRRSLVVAPTNPNEKSQPLQRKSWSFSPNVSKNTKKKIVKSKEEPTKVPKMKISPILLKPKTEPKSIPNQKSEVKSTPIIQPKPKPKPKPKEEPINQSKLESKPEPKPKPKLHPVSQPKSSSSPQPKYNTPSKKPSQLTSTPRTKSLKSIEDPKDKNHNQTIEIKKTSYNSVNKVQNENKNTQNMKSTYSTLKLNKKRDSKKFINSNNHKTLMDFIFAQSKENKKILLSVMSSPKLNKLLHSTFNDVKKCKFKNEIDENNAWEAIISRWKKYI